MNNIQPAGPKRWTIKSDELPGKFLQQENQFHQELPVEAGTGYSDLFVLEEGLYLIETQYSPARDFSVLSSIEYDEPQIIITLGLNGCSRFSGLGRDVVFNEGFTAITAVTSSIGERQYSANKPINQLRLAIRKKWLDLNFDQHKIDRWFNKSGVQLISYQPISAQSLLITKQFLAGNMAGGLKRVFMQGFARVLLASELNPIHQNGIGYYKHFNKQDHQIAENARAILADEFNNPPSINALSKRVGTNPLKLKQLFHHYYNNTPYGILFEIRMHHAYQLLKTTRCHVNIAADYVGYSHASNFTAAFTRFFGISPKNVSKS